MQTETKLAYISLLPCNPRSPDSSSLFRLFSICALSVLVNMFACPRTFLTTLMWYSSKGYVLLQ